MASLSVIGWPMCQTAAGCSAAADALPGIWVVMVMGVFGRKHKLVGLELRELVQSLLLRACFLQMVGVMRSLKDRSVAFT